MGLTRTVKTSLVAGVALIAPLLVTVIAFQLVFGWIRGFLTPIVESIGLVSLVGIEVVAEVLALVILVLAIASLGYLAQRSAGAYVFGVVDRVIGLVPILSVVYNGVRQVSDALTRQESRFESVVLVEYPREGVYSFGFVTAETSDHASPPDEDTYNVYMPGSPNPTQGHLLFVPEEEFYPVDIKVSRAIRLLVTTGIAENREELEQLHEEVAEEVAEEDVEIRF
ncbi:DUF502 domain-containing protein [Salinirussus salinus]|jgi:uncharacterized membrane protein|uniref:DUF502 domain-containing protein n=1 Tax=Salinirussus salinus TaxID=1198300 RepID=UPI0013573B75|nr:DUF502 domain-containing protein [Salinirussus salinus]